MFSSKSMVALVLLCLGGRAIAEHTRANPIRKVVTMLQDMQKSVESEGEKEKELFEKFMCYCNNGAGALDTAIESGKAAVEQLSSKIESDSATKSQLEQDVVQHKSDREAADKTIKESTAMREKEAAEFAATSGEMKANVEAMGGALAALKKGLSSALLQTNVGSLLRNVVSNSPAVNDGQREMLMSLLQSGSDEQEGGSDQIIGIVEQMKETMEGDLKESTASEAEAKASFETLMTSKNKEIAAAGKAIEQKTARIGQVAVEVVQAKADLEGTEDAVAEDTKLKSNLAESCKTKQAEWDERQKLRAQELEALSETIEMLNGDDALELFKKTMPSGPSMSLQTGAATKYQMRRARVVLQNLLGSSSHTSIIHLMLVSLHGKSGGGFDKVVKMVDDMVTLLAKEQQADDAKKDLCIADIDKTEDEKKAIEGSVADLEAEEEELGDSIATVASEIEALKNGLQELDKSVVIATEQRKDEHSEYTDTQAANQAALELIGMAKNRMNKFYNPSQYKAPETTTESTSAYGLLQVSLSSKRADPGPAPETFGDYKKSDSGGVLGMMTTMAKDVEMDIQAGKMDEKTAQKDYEEAMKDAAVKRSDDSKLIVTKEGERAEMTSKLEETREAMASKRTELGNTNDALNDLHKTCDFLLDNYDSRKDSRTKESEGLKQAKAVLSGAKFGFLQQR